MLVSFGRELERVTVLRPDESSHGVSLALKKKHNTVHSEAYGAPEPTKGSKRLSVGSKTLLNTSIT